MKGGEEGEDKYSAEEVKLVIKCTFLVSQECIRDYVKEITESPPLPEYILKKGPYVNNKEKGVHQLIILYKFDKWKFAEAWENISKQLSSFGALPGFTVSAHTYGPHPGHLTLEKAKEIKEYVDLGSRVASELRVAYEQ